MYIDGELQAILVHVANYVRKHGVEIAAMNIKYILSTLDTNEAAPPFLKSLEDAAGLVKFLGWLSTNPHVWGAESVAPESDTGEFQPVVDVDN